MLIMSYPRVLLRDNCWRVELARNKIKSLSLLGFIIPNGEEGRKEAMKIEKELQDSRNAKVLTELLRGKKHEIEPYIKLYLERRKLTVAKNTWIADTNSLQKFKKFCLNHNLTFIQSITFDHLDEFKAQLLTELKPNSVGVHLRHLKIFFSMAEQKEIITKNPMRFLKMPKCGDPDTKFHSEEEIIQILLRCMNEPVFKYTIPISYYLGISRNDICKTIKKYNGMLIYRRAKTKHEIIVPISKELDSYIHDLPDGDLNLVPWHVDTYSHKYAELCKEAGVKSSTHMMRHSCATHIMLHGGNIKHVKELLGHAQLSTTERYAKLALSNLRDAAGRLA